MKDIKNQNLLIISGPTAAGKSDLALRLASELSGEIISLDSVQVYRGFDIGTAKASGEARTTVPHHLIDIREPGELYNAQRFVEDAEEKIADIRSRGKLPILVGGTTMYLTSLLHGLASLPERDSKLREEFSKCDQAELYEKLVKIDPDHAARISPRDNLRTVRALETHALTGQLPSKLLAEHDHGDQKYKALILVVMLEREELYARINERTKKMLELGLVDEVVRLREKFGDEIAGFNSIGYREVLSFLKGEIAEENLENLISQNTRQFAKRQMTYWRNEPGKRGWGVAPVQRETKEKIKKFTGFEIEIDTLSRDITCRIQEGFVRNEVWYLKTLLPK